ncbi:MAG: GDP/UDP-N,N'-diacetylbacillosamine 2-epimerase (hydrolyzing) [Paraglaciecola sp.]|jgi:GDP/UDP-N,N'-diacetylbacillosamine 2-epimerase (hydrolysing)
MTRKICVVTGTRADYGLLRWLMQYIKDSAELELQIIATCMHLSPEFGLTYTEIENDGFNIDIKVEMLLSSDTASSVTKSMGLGLIGFADALENLKPDIMVVLGDRFEILSATSAALIAKVPVAHLHGGEISEGAVDDSMRHAITKMSHLHFVATQEYRDRVIQLGEQPANIFLVGGIGIDNIKKCKLMNKNELESSLGFSFGSKNIIVTFHPATLGHLNSYDQMSELLAALSLLKNTNIIFTMPNADADSRIIGNMINEFVGKYANCKSYVSLGYLRYLSCLQYVDAVVGNSSSGLIEAPSFKKGTINIGSRQDGRAKAKSVIDCSTDKESILNAFNKLYSGEFKKTLKYLENPYGDGGASEQIVNILKKHQLDGLLKKKFHDFNLEVQ